MSSDVWPGSLRRRETLIRLPISELAEWHLMVSCAACRAERILPVRSLAERYGGDRTLVVLLPRLRCGVASCRRPPSLVRLRSRFPAHPGPPLVEVVVMRPPVAGPGA
jgi:hypothetical protein